MLNSILIENCNRNPESSPKILNPKPDRSWRRGVVFAVFLLFVSGAGLFIFGEFHKTAGLCNPKLYLRLSLPTVSWVAPTNYGVVATKL